MFPKCLWVSAAHWNRDVKLTESCRRWWRGVEWCTSVKFNHSLLRGEKAWMVNTLSENEPKQPRAFKLFPPTIYGAHRLPSLRHWKSAPLRGGGMIVSIYDLRFCFLCVPAAQRIDPVSKTTTPACCWGSLRESRTRGQQTSSPAGHVTLGSGTAVTSEYNVMSVLSTSSSQEWLLPCIICSHWPTCWHQLTVICMKIHAGIHENRCGLSIRIGDRTFCSRCQSKEWSVLGFFGN